MLSHLLDDPDRKRKRSTKNPRPILDWIQHWHKVGNNHADILASEARERFDLDGAVAKPVVVRVEQLKLIQKRIASIICHLPSRPKQPRVKPIPMPRVSQDDLFSVSSHSFFPSNATLAFHEKLVYKVFIMIK